MKTNNYDETVIKETIILVKLFLKYNLSDVALAEATNMSSSTIQRRLTNKENIIKAFDVYTMDSFENDSKLSYGEYIFELVQKKRKENLQEARKKGGLESQKNNAYIKALDGEFSGNKQIINLEYLYNNPKKSEDEQKKLQYTYLMHIMLYFRLRYQSLAELLNVDVETLKKNMTRYNNNTYVSLFQMDNTFFASNQKKAQADVMEYYNELKNAKKENDKETLKKLLHQVDDSMYKLVKDNYKKKLQYVGKTNTRAISLSDEEILVILKFQLKYSLSTLTVADDMGLNRNTLGKRYRNLFSKTDEYGNKIFEYQVLEHHYEHMADFYQTKAIENEYRRR